LDLPAISILVVEDEPALRQIMVVMLEEAGYAVVSFENGEEAIATLESKISDYLALVTDVRLSRGKHRLTGWDVAQRARELNPELPVIYMTGDSAADWPSHGVPKSVLVTKPFVPSQIITALAQLLNETA
jgi:CheY-like chemotaxis protein